MLMQSPGDAAKTVISAAPSGYLIAWLAGIPVEKWAAFAALMWTLYLFAREGWTKLVKPRLHKHRGR